MQQQAGLGIQRAQPGCTAQACLLLLPPCLLATVPPRLPRCATFASWPSLAKWPAAPGLGCGTRPLAQGCAACWLGSGSALTLLPSCEPRHALNEGGEGEGEEQHC